MIWRVRVATPGYARVLAAIHAEAFAAPWSEEDFATLLRDPGALALMIVDPTEEPAGFIFCRATLDEAEILTFAVRPACRRRGLATRLLADAGARLAAGGVDNLLLEVAEDNTAARALYEALGFVPVGRRRGYYARPGGPAVDALVLSAGVPMVSRD